MHGNGCRHGGQCRADLWSWPRSKAKRREGEERRRPKWFRDSTSRAHGRLFSLLLVPPDDPITSKSQYTKSQCELLVAKWTFTPERHWHGLASRGQWLQTMRPWLSFPALEPSACSHVILWRSTTCRCSVEQVWMFKTIRKVNGNGFQPVAGAFCCMSRCLGSNGQQGRFRTQYQAPMMFRCH